MKMMEKINVNLNIESSQQELEKMYDEVVNSPIGMQELKKMGIIEEKIKDNIVKIYDFVKDIEYCSSCPGVKKCKKNNPLLCTKLTYFNGFVERQLEPCKHLLEQVKYEGRFCFKDFDEKFDNISIKDKNFDFGKKRATIFKEFQSILKSNQKKWLFLSGKPQTGKTYLSIALLNYALTFKKVDGKIGFINTSFRFKELNDYSYSNKEEFNSMMQSLSNCEILIMDDFGNEFKNDFIRDGILFSILSNRSNKKLLTIFTSNFDIDEVVEMYSTSKAGGIRARQIGRILKENCLLFNLGELSIY